MPATGIVTQKIGEFEYRVASDDGIDAEFTGTSISKEPLSKGERVRIINVSSGRADVPEYGFCRETSGLRGVVGVPDGQKEGFANNSPCNYIAAYVAYHAGKITQLYDIAEVIASTGSRLNVVMLTGDVPYLETTLNCSGVWAGSFVAGDIALVRRGSRPLVVGWWQVNIITDVVLFSRTKYQSFFNEKSVVKNISFVPPMSAVVFSGALTKGQEVYLSMSDGRLTVGSVPMPGDYYRIICGKYSIEDNTFVPIKIGEAEYVNATTSGIVEVDNKIYVIPGGGGAAAIGNTKYGIIENDVFSYGVELADRLFSLGPCVIGKKIYSIAGANIVAYDTASNSVSIKAALPHTVDEGISTSRYGFMAKVSNETLVLFSDSFIEQSIGIYNVSGDSLTTIPFNKSGVVSAAVFGSLVFFVQDNGTELFKLDLSDNSIVAVETFSAAFIYRRCIKISSSRLLLFGTKIGSYDITKNKLEEFTGTETLESYEIGALV